MACFLHNEIESNYGLQKKSNSLRARIMQTLRKQKGFSLVELMVVVAIIGIVVAFTLPNIRSMMEHMRLGSAARDLHGTIMKAKVVAARCNRNATLVFNQVIGATTFAYVLFVDCDGDSEYDVGESILVQQQQWPQGVNLSAVTFPGNDDVPSCPSISFKPNSIPTGNGGGLANGTATLTNTNGVIRSVIVNRSGNVRIQ